MLAQASQALVGGMRNWSPTEWTVFSVLVTGVIGALTTSIISIIKSIRGETKSDAAMVQSTTASQHASSARVQSAENAGAIRTLQGTGDGGIAIAVEKLSQSVPADLAEKMLNANITSPASPSSGSGETK